MVTFVILAGGYVLGWTAAAIVAWRHDLKRLDEIDALRDEIDTLERTNQRLEWAARGAVDRRGA